MKLIEAKVIGHGEILFNPDQIVAIKLNARGQTEICLASMVDLVTLNISVKEFLQRIHHTGVLEEIVEVE